MNRATLKNSAKNVLRKNYPASFLMCLVYDTIIGELGANIAVAYSFFAYISGDYFSAFKKANYNELDSVSKISTIVSIVSIVLLLIVFVVFLTGPLAVAKSNFFIYARNDSFSSSSVFDVFRDKTYSSALKAMFLKRLIICISSILIIPGIYYSYAYFFVGQIVSENPGISPKEALQKSRQITRGHLFELIVLKLSFTGWYLLCAVIPIFGKYFIDPYYEATVTEAYYYLRQI